MLLANQVVLQYFSNNAIHIAATALLAFVWKRRSQEPGLELSRWMPEFKQQVSAVATPGFEGMRT